MMPDESHLPAGAPADTHPPGAVVGSGPGYEVRDTNVVAIVTFVVVLFVALIVTQVGLWGLLKAIAGRPGSGTSTLPASPYAESPRAGAAVVPSRGKITPEVVLEITEQRRELRAREDAILNGYARPGAGAKDGPIRIPIDRAIDLIADRGLPATGRAARTEVEVNSHSGTPATKDEGAPKKELKK